MQIKTNSVEERNSLLGALLAIGYKWHGANELTTPAQIENRWKFERWPIIDADLLSMTLGGNSSSVTSDYSWSQDADTILKNLSPSLVKKSIRVNQVGDYHAKIDAEGIHVYNTTISFDKFDEIAAAVAKFNE